MKSLDVPKYPLLEGGLALLPQDGEPCTDCLESNPEPPAPGHGLYLIRSEDDWLVQECLQGNQQAWERLIDKYKRLIYSIPFRYGAKPEDAADIFQLVCIEMLNSLRTLRNTSCLRAWLMTVTAHQSFHWKKRQTNNLELDAMEQEAREAIATTPDAAAEVQQRQSLREALSQLPPRCARLLDLLFLQQPGLPYAEVARRLGLATGSIGFIRGRCLDKLRAVLLEHGYR